MIKTNAGKITPGTIKGNEAFSPESMKMLKAIHDDNISTSSAVTRLDHRRHHPEAGVRRALRLCTKPRRPLPGA